MSKNPELNHLLIEQYLYCLLQNLLKAAFARNAVICFAIFQLDNIIPNVLNIPPLLLKAPDTLPITLTKALRNLLIGERIAFFKAFLL